MPKTSEKPRKKSISASVLSISKQGLWLLAGSKEYFLSHREFPWFKGAAVEHVLHVTQPAMDHLYWPDLDVDLHVHGLERPERYPVKFELSARRVSDG
jgi:hypothetical protein